MTLSAQSILDFPVPQATHVVTARDAILYALSVGYGTSPLDENALNYVYERNLVTAPTLANIVAHPARGCSRRVSTGRVWCIPNIA